MNIDNVGGCDGGAPTALTVQLLWPRIRELQQRNDRRLVTSLAGTAAALALYDVAMLLWG